MALSDPANRLRVLRESRHLQRVEVAAICRVGERTIFRWETGESSIPDEQKLRLAEFFDVDPSYLMGWADEPTRAAA